MVSCRVLCVNVGMFVSTSESAEQMLAERSVSGRIKMNFIIPDVLFICLFLMLCRLSSVDFEAKAQ